MCLWCNLLLAIFEKPAIDVIALPYWVGLAGADVESVGFLTEGTEWGGSLEEFKGLDHQETL